MKNWNNADTKCYQLSDLLRLLLILYFNSTEQLQALYTRTCMHRDKVLDQNSLGNKMQAETQKTTVDRIAKGNSQAVVSWINDDRQHISSLQLKGKQTLQQIAWTKDVLSFRDVSKGGNN